MVNIQMTLDMWIVGAKDAAALTFTSEDLSNVDEEPPQKANDRTTNQARDRNRDRDLKTRMRSTSIDQNSLLPSCHKDLIAYLEWARVHIAMTVHEVDSI